MTNLICVLSLSIGTIRILSLNIWIHLLFISFSYKEEDSENQTDSDDLLEITAPTTAADEEDENRETIEKVIMHRQGRKGGKYLILITVKNKIAALAYVVDLYY